MIVKRTCQRGVLLAYNGPVRRFIFLSFLVCCWIALSLATTQAAALGESTSRFYYKDSTGYPTSARIIRHYRRAPIVHPLAHVDPNIDPKLQRAATIAQERANAHSKMLCWHYVKEALVAAGVVKSYPKTVYAFEAGAELVRDYGFKRLSIRDPYSAPVGAVLVYGSRSWGHIEIRTKNGFVSDYHSKRACFYPLVAVYGKFSS